MATAMLSAAMAGDEQMRSVLAGVPELAETMHALLSTVADRRGADVITISAPGDRLEASARRIDLPDGVEEWVSPIVAAVGAQLFTYHLAVARGLDPDSPRGLGKITKTW